MAKKTGKMTLEIGILFRETVIAKIKNFCFDQDVSLDIEEDKLLLSSNYRIKIKGEETKVDRCTQAIDRFIQKIGRS
jgi:hypothetical protein